MANTNVTVPAPAIQPMMPSIGQALMFISQQKRMADLAEQRERHFRLKYQQQERKQQEDNEKWMIQNAPDVALPVYGEQIKIMVDEALDAGLQGDIEGGKKLMAQADMYSKQVESVKNTRNKIVDIVQKTNSEYGKEIIRMDAAVRHFNNQYHDEENRLRDPFKITSESMSAFLDSAEAYDLQNSADAYADGLQKIAVESVEDIAMDSGLANITKKNAKSSFFALDAEGEIDYDDKTGLPKLAVTGQQVNAMRKHIGLKQHMDEMVSQARAGGDKSYSYSDAAHDILDQTGYLTPEVSYEVETKTKPQRQVYIGGSAQKEKLAFARVKGTKKLLDTRTIEEGLALVRGKRGVKKATERTEGNVRIIKIDIDPDKLIQQQIPLTGQYDAEGNQLYYQWKGKIPKEMETHEIRINLDDPRAGLLAYNNWVDWATSGGNVGPDLYNEAWDALEGGQTEDDTLIEEISNYFKSFE